VGGLSQAVSPKNQAPASQRSFEFSYKQQPCGVLKVRGLCHAGEFAPTVNRVNQYIGTIDRWTLVTSDPAL